MQLKNIFLLLIFPILFGMQPHGNNQTETADVIIYGGTAAAVIAAVQVKAMGKSVIVISPDTHLGGMSSG